jgi:hypothetical protein
MPGYKKNSCRSGKHTTNNMVPKSVYKTFVVEYGRHCAYRERQGKPKKRKTAPNGKNLTSFTSKAASWPPSSLWHETEIRKSQFLIQVGSSLGLGACPWDSLKYECELYLKQSSTPPQRKIVVAYHTSNHRLVIEIEQWLKCP